MPRERKSAQQNSLVHGTSRCPPNDLGSKVVDVNRKEVIQEAYLSYNSLNQRMKVIQIIQFALTRSTSKSQALLPPELSLMHVHSL